MTYLLLAASFVLVVGGALLFTNAVEWLGHELSLGQGAVGSVLAAVATALPESTIPVVAIVKGTEESQDVAIGAIVGAPFMLATIAMMLVGIAAFAFQSSRPQDEEIAVHEATLRRDLLFFLAIFGLALLLGAGSPAPLRYAAAGLFVVAYISYVAWSLTRGGRVQAEEDLSPLYFDLSRGDAPNALQMGGQFLLALASIIYGAHLFVDGLTAVAEAVGVSALVLALVIAPLATELPEKVNSFIWVRSGKDSLALGNITGAMVFQSSLPVAIGLVFTSWELRLEAAVACGLGLAGGALAAWAGLARERFGLPAILAWGALFAGFVAFVSLRAG